MVARSAATAAQQPLNTIRGGRVAADTQRDWVSWWKCTRCGFEVDAACRGRANIKYRHLKKCMPLQQGVRHPRLDAANPAVVVTLPPEQLQWKCPYCPMGLPGGIAKNAFYVARREHLRRCHGEMAGVRGDWRTGGRCMVTSLATKQQTVLQASARRNPSHQYRYLRQGTVSRAWWFCCVCWVPFAPNMKRGLADAFWLRQCPGEP